MLAMQAQLPGGVTLGLDFTYHAMPINLCPMHFRQRYSGVATSIQQTVCSIYTMPESDPLAKPAFMVAGAAYCSPFDTFVKETGRKLALARALDKGKINRDDRRLLWEAYHLRGERAAAKAGVPCVIGEYIDGEFVEYFREGQGT